jgi:hemerythrin superfamily protein
VKATELLKQQHRTVDDLFKKFEKAGDEQQPDIFLEIAGTLVAHDAIEREIFYPACEKALGDEDILKESLVEHGLVEFCIFRADKNRNKDTLESYVKVLKEVVQHHVEEEEEELLPKVEKAMKPDQLEALGNQMMERFEDAHASDFRKPLRDNLQQVLAGRAKTKKASKRPAKRAPARRARAVRKSPAKKSARASVSKRASR